MEKATGFTVNQVFKIKTQMDKMGTKTTQRETDNGFLERMNTPRHFIQGALAKSITKKFSM